MQPSSSWHPLQENTSFESLLDYCHFLQTRQVPQLKAARMYYIILYYFNLHNLGRTFFFMKQARRENIHLPESNFFVSSQKHFFWIKIFFINCSQVHSPTPRPPLPSPLHKGGMRFFKMALMGGGDRSSNPLFYEDPLYCLLWLLFQILSNPLFPSPPIPVTSTRHPKGSFCCPVSFAEWVITPHLMCCFT